MRIVIDGFGGDNVPLEPMKAAAAAVAEYGVEMIITGDCEKMKQCAEQNNINLEGITFYQADSVIPMDEEPTKILKVYSDCSMAVGLKLVADGEADAMVSAGSTGALLAGATFIVKRSKGIKRPVIATLIPTGGKRKFYLLIDSGANSDCRPEMLNQFAVMGTAYHKRILKSENPEVALVNIGVEEHKGCELQQQSYKLLKENSCINFIGNVEARELPNGGCDIAVCDGFTGNIVLKLTEGFAAFFTGVLKNIFYTNAATKAAYLLVSKPIKVFRKSMDSKEQGGAPILGVKKPVIKAHGNSDAKAFKNAIRQAKYCIEQDVCGEIERGVAQLKAEETADA